MKRKLLFLVPMFFLLGITGSSNATTLDVWDWNSISNTGTIIGQIDTIATNQTGAQHYNYYSYSGHPSDVNLDTYFSNLWVHENINTGEYSFGFIFSADNSPDASNYAELWFRIVDSASDVYVSLSDDAGEAVEQSTPGWFYGNYYYGHNTDGIMVSGITGSDWTIMIDAVDFGDITNWFAASGGVSGFSDDLSLTLGNEYRITLEGNTPSGLVVNPDVVPEPSTMLLFGSGLIGLAGIARRKMTA